MKNDESMIDRDRMDPIQMDKLDVVLGELIQTLQNGRSNIFDIAEDCQKHCLYLETEIERINLEVSEIIQKVDKQEKLEKLARLRLMEVSGSFRSFSEVDIKEAYLTAQKMQIELINLRQKEAYIRQQRDEMVRQLKRFQAIAAKADSFLNNTGLALKILQGNVEKISESIEDAYRKQQLEMWIIQSQEAERRKIARELHDGPAQALASMLIRLDLASLLYAEDGNRSRDEINNVKAMCRESLGDIRRIMFDLKPTLVHDVGLVTTLRDYFNDYEVKYNFNIDFVVFGGEKKYDLALEIAFLRMAQEAITNVRKHAAINRAMVKLEDTKGVLTMVIKDEGLGFDMNEVVSSEKESYGILGMKERVALLGGGIDIISAPGSGTQVIIKVPLEGEDSNGQNQGINSR